MNNAQETKALKEKYADFPDLEIVELMTPGEDPSESLRKNLSRLNNCLNDPETLHLQ